MRKVRVFKYERKLGDTFHTKIDDGLATFHRWGVDYEELENGVGNYSTAIIEREDGSVKNVPVALIAFVQE